MPCSRGLRIPVETIGGVVADGMTAREILEAEPDLQGVPESASAPSPENMWRTIAAEHRENRTSDPT